MRGAAGIAVEEATIPELQQAMASGRETAVSLDATLPPAHCARLDKAGPRLNSVIELNPDALDIAQTA